MSNNTHSVGVQKPKGDIEEKLLVQMEIISVLEIEVQNLTEKTRRICFSVPTSESKEKGNELSTGTLFGDDLRSNNSKLNDIICRIKFLNDNLAI